MATAIKEMQAQVARARVRTSLAAPVPAASRRDENPGEIVLVHREPPVDQWVGPHHVVFQKGKEIWLAVDGVLKQYGIDKVKLYHPPLSVDPCPALSGPPTSGSSTAPIAAPDPGRLSDPLVNGAHFLASVRTGCSAFVSKMRRLVQEISRTPVRSRARVHLHVPGPPL